MVKLDGGRKGEGDHYYQSPRKSRNRSLKTALKMLPNTGVTKYSRTLLFVEVVGPMMLHAIALNNTVHRKKVNHSTEDVQ